MRNSPYHAIAKWLAEKLKPVQRQLAPRSYRDTFEFIDDIKDLNVNGMVMSSLDVSSLFTNVPVTETVDYLCDFLSASQQEIGIPTNTLKELLLRCTLNVQFLFDNHLYRQGVAMGSPLGPLLADVFMGKLERFQISEQINKLKHYGRYVDDIFAIATAEADVATLLDAANQAHPSTKFTLEMETTGSLPFLDVLLSRRPDGSVRRSVYRKKPWSVQYANFASFVPLQQKRNLVRCLAQRARKICSTDSIEEDLRKIQDFLRENGYPERFIEKNIAERPIKPATPTAEKKTLFLMVPFQGDAASELLRRRLDQTVSRTFPAARVQIAFSTNPILRGEDCPVKREFRFKPELLILATHNGRHIGLSGVRQANALLGVMLSPIASSKSSPDSLLNGGTCFDQLDFADAYLQIEVVQDSYELLTINTHRGLLQYTRLRFGVKAAPTLFQQTTNALLSGIPGTAVHLDDIIVIVGHSPAELQDRVCEQYSANKYQFFLGSIKFLEFVFYVTGRNPDPENITAAQQIPAPKNVSQLSTYLRLIN
ncbi:hypothetical protein SprV_1002898200 [Sparganum proliferum]